MFVPSVSTAFEFCNGVGPPEFQTFHIGEFFVVPIATNNVELTALHLDATAICHGEREEGAAVDPAPVDAPDV